MSGLCIAQEKLLNKSLNESVVFVRHGFGVELETTIFKPDGDGPFPLAVLNHGKEFGNPLFQPRSRYIVAARELVRRGYVVAIPMRGGFSKSSGRYVDGGCNIAGNAKHQATYVRSALDYMTKQPYVDRSRIVIFGQSHGGLTTMAFSTEPYEGVRGILNFAGGLRLTGAQCFDWENVLVAAFRDFGRSARYPTVWFYGDNDSYFEIALAKRMYEAFVSAGGKGQLVAYGPFKSDSHRLFGDRDGLKVWWPEAERFLQALGMPVEVLPRTTPDDPQLAALSDTAKIPHIRENCVRGYNLFLDYDYPRAFAISADAHCGYAYGGEDPKKRALDTCQRLAKEPCRLYAVDNGIVWN
jgi:dienelactone hydrolase